MLCFLKGTSCCTQKSLNVIKCFKVLSETFLELYLYRENTQMILECSCWMIKSARGNTVSLNRLKTKVNAYYTGHTQKNGAVSKVNKKFISHHTRAQRTPSAAATVQVSHAVPAVRFLCLLRGRGASFQDGVAAEKGFLCATFWGVQICDYSAAWVSCTV